MIYVLMQRHPSKNALKFYSMYADPHNFLLHVAADHLVDDYADRFCFDDLHPEDQVKAVRKLVKENLQSEEEVVLIVNSLVVIYALNNELLRNNKLKVNAWEVLPTGKRNSAIKDRWIDESVLGHVSEKLSLELNKLRDES